MAPRPRRRGPTWIGSCLACGWWCWTRCSRCARWTWTCRRARRQDECGPAPALKAAIARAAAEGQPYTKTGGNGVYERRHELPEAFHAIGKHRLADWVGTLLGREELVMAMAQGSKLVKWLDVPDGPVASGQAVFVTGHLGRSGAGRPDGGPAFPDRSGNGLPPGKTGLSRLPGHLSKERVSIGNAHLPRV